MSEHLEIRLQKLENENRRWRRSTLVLCLIIGSLVLMGQTKSTKPPAFLKAQALELVDSSGKTVAALDARKQGRVELRIWNEKDEDLLILAAQEGGSILRLVNGAGEMATLLAADIGPAIQLEKPSSKAMASLGIGKAGPAIVVTEPSRDASVSMGIGANGAVLSMEDRGKMGAAIVVGPGARAIELYDSLGKKTFTAPK